VKLRRKIYRWLRCRNYLLIVTVAAPILLLAVVFMGVYKQERVYDANSKGHQAVGDYREVPNPPTSQGVQEGILSLRHRHTGGSLAARRQTFIVTAYCPCRKCCGPRACGITASGKPVTANGGFFLAADRAVPFGTMIRVPGYAGGRAVPVLDRGGAIRGNRLDLFFPTHKAALAFGRKTLTCERSW
jgi:3D (Asp-Asp-Asp) domain-containing protein